MPQPIPYAPTADFSADELANAGGRSTVRTAALDAELAAVAATLAGVRANLALNQRDDGEIRDERVKLHTLSPDVRALLALSGTTIRGEWVTGTSYAARDVVSVSGGAYIAASAHVSAASFAADLSAGRWLPVGTSGTSVYAAEPRIIGAPGQTVLSLAVATYTPGANAVQVVVDGLRWRSGVDYTETSATTLTLAQPLRGDEQIDVYVGAFVTAGISAAQAVMPSPGTGGVPVTLADEVSRGRVSVHRFSGVVGDGVNDDSAGINAAISLTQSAGLGLDFDGSKTYKVTAPLVWWHGRNSTDAQAYNVDVRGNGCVLLPDHGGDVMRIEPRCPDSDVGTGREVARIEFGGFFVNGYFITLNARTSARALRIGKTAFMVDSFPKSKVYDITVQSFLAPPFVIEQSRMLKCERLISRDMAGGVQLLILRDGFVGDITFEDCEFQGNETRRTFHVFAEASSAFAEARGIRFLNCVFYGSGGLLESGANGKLDDVWLSFCACDGPDAPAGETPIEVYARDGGSISQVFVNHPYIVNYTGPAIIARSTGASTLAAVEISGGYLRQISAAAVIDLISAENTTVRGVHFIGNTGTDEVRISSDSSHVSVRDCDSDSGCTNFATIAGTTDNFLVRGNMHTNAGGIVRTATGATYSITDNLLVTA